MVHSVYLLGELVEGKNYEPAWLEVKLFVAARLSYARRLDASRLERTVQKR